uniref:WGS project CBMI000000000 data, contig CS3069_c004489 n=1 Tax=Fusarium clavum TaxID=2594811 RepID=A0A090N629_9HYPO|nr:unnamed protein product [Fusarium clavum]CEG05967.1 unnamed protein product [Fusarium clavum]
MDAQDAAARARDPKLHEAIASYLQTHTEAYDALVRFIKYRRQKKSPEEPLDGKELQARYDCIRGIIEKQRIVRGNKDWMVSNIQLAYLLRMGRSKLEDFSVACGKQRFLPFQGQLILDGWGPLTRHCK